MSQIRKRCSAAFRAEVAFEAAKRGETIAELAKQRQVHPARISRWRRRALDGLEGVFEYGSTSRRPDPEKLQTKLCERIGRLQMELARVKKIWRPTSRRGGVESSRTARDRAFAASASCRGSTAPARATSRRENLPTTRD